MLERLTISALSLLIMCVYVDDVVCSTWPLVRSWTIDLQYIWSINPFTRKENLSHTCDQGALPYNHIHSYYLMMFMQLKHRPFSTMATGKMRWRDMVAETYTHTTNWDSGGGGVAKEWDWIRNAPHPFGIWSQNAEMGLRFQLAIDEKIYRNNVRKHFVHMRCMKSVRDRETKFGSFSLCAIRKMAGQNKSMCEYEYRKFFSYIISKCNI